MSADRPLVSIIIPTFNCEATIGDCLTSITSQTYKNIEVLVLDGLSKDRTVAIAREASINNGNIHVSTESDAGIYDAINKGMRRARGEWVYVIGADDTLYSPDTLESLQPHFSDASDYLYGKIFHQHRNRFEGEPVDRQALLTKGIYHQATFLRKRLVSRIGEYNLRYKICADWEYSLRCFGAGATPKFVDVVVANYSGTGASSRQADVDFGIDKLRLASTYFKENLLGEFFRPHRFTFHEQSMLCSKQRKFGQSFSNYLLYAYHSVMQKLSRPKPENR